MKKLSILYNEIIVIVEINKSLSINYFNKLIILKTGCIKD